MTSKAICILGNIFKKKENGCVHTDGKERKVKAEHTSLVHVLNCPFPMKTRLRSRRGVMIPSSLRICLRFVAKAAEGGVGWGGMMYLGKANGMRHRNPTSFATEKV